MPIPSVPYVVYDDLVLGSRHHRFANLRYTGSEAFDQKYCKVQKLIINFRIKDHEINKVA